MTDSLPPPADFEEDPRYAVAVREMGIAVVYWAAFTTVVVATAWLLGGNKPAEELTFVLGFPTWFFYSVLASSLAFSVIPYFLVRFLFTDMPLTPEGRLPAQGADKSAATPDTEGR